MLKKSFFQKKPQESFHLKNLFFNKFVVEKVQTQKHLGIKLDKRLSLKDHIKDNFSKVNREFGILKKLNVFLPRHSLITSEAATGSVFLKKGVQKMPQFL